MCKIQCEITYENVLTHVLSGHDKVFMDIDELSGHGAKFLVTIDIIINLQYFLIVACQCFVQTFFHANISM